MSRLDDAVKGVLPPIVGGPGHYEPQRLAGTGTTESSTSRKLTPGKLYEIWVFGAVGTNDIRITMRPTGGLANQVSTTDFVLTAGTVFPFIAMEGDGVNYGALFVYAEAADGTSAYEAFVIQRGI